MIMKAIAFLALTAALCGGAWAQQGSAYTTPGGTRHYNGPNGYHGSSYTTPGGTTHYSDNRGTSVSSCTFTRLGREMGSCLISSRMMCSFAAGMGLRAIQLRTVASVT